MREQLVPSHRRLWLYAFVGIVLLFLILPIFVVIPVSFSNSKYLGFPPPGYSMQWYEAYLNSSEWLAATRASLVAATLTAIVATILGTAAAYYVNTLSPRAAQYAALLVMLPIIVPNILIAIGIFYVYVQIRQVNSMAGIVAAHTLLALPFVMLTVLAGFKSFDERQEKAARSLGAPPLQAFFAVTFPQIRPSVISAGLLAFIISLDEVVISLFVAGGQNTVLTRRMFVALRDAIDPTIAAISTFFILASLTMLGTVALTGRRSRRPPPGEG